MLKKPEAMSDAASVHSLPAVVHQPPQPPPQSPQTTPTTSSQRRERHRSAVEVRSSNRLSGFFTSLISRRDSPTSHAQNPIPEQPDPPSRPRSPTPTPVPVAVPPSLPPPTLNELGLSLSALTDALCPSHFSTPPASGAFLAPHYLLLCHAQGLDVLPLISPPAPQPYALVRRVAFKSVVIMEHRGVLVAIAGRRDGVRVYALEEVKKAIEWRIDVEVRRERERMRREAAKRVTLKYDIDPIEDKVHKASLSTPPPMGEKPHILRKMSQGNLPLPPPLPPPPLVPRPARTPTRKSRLPRPSSAHSEPPRGQPPPYAGPVEHPSPFLRNQPSAVSVRARARGNSVSNVLAGVTTAVDPTEEPALRPRGTDEKTDDWAGSSDDEAIDIRAAASGSQALDERTSATLSANRNPPAGVVIAQAPPTGRPRASTSSSRRRRPSSLDLTASRHPTVPNPEPSPTLLNLRQALHHPPPSANTFDEGDDDEDDADGRISLAQALLESRIPELPPLGTVQPQEPVLLSAVSQVFDEPMSASPRSSEGHEAFGTSATLAQQTRRRRWSVLLRSSSSSQEQSRASTPSQNHLQSSNYLSPSNNNLNGHSSRSPSLRANTLPIASVPSPPSTAVSTTSHVPSSATSITSTTSRSSRFIPRIISNALSRRSEERLPQPMTSIDTDSGKWFSAHSLPPAPAPKLEYVKLPGTKGALLIKAVETPKKSFLAILCGENGEKVELFAGTYRTALGLSRTFILPDSPRSLELQLQGDDLVEVFLVFSQNVFGLEPATVRVREVRIGRAERRAARRRAREHRAGETPMNESENNEEETSVNVSIGVSVAVGPTTPTLGDGQNRASTPTLVASDHPTAPHDDSRTDQQESVLTGTSAQEELVAVATAQMGPYTTFQQLSFAPKFPLASIADDYVIPPTYPDFLEYRHEHEPEEQNLAPSSSQFSPPGLPAPLPVAPVQWYYKDPRGIIRGPWSPTLMHAWYRDDLLPADLPVRREGETEYTLLRDLKMQCVDPTQPFRTPAPLLSSLEDPPESLYPASISETKPKPLLPPISLLCQPKHYGPPALFFSSRGGHSTAIVDARGKSVLKGRFIWSSEESLDDSDVSSAKMGDIRRIEALDVNDRSVLVAMRQGGLEAVDLSDALLRPADQSRTILPYYSAPLNAINRRPPCVWKIGTPIICSSNTTTSIAALSSTKGGKSSLGAVHKRTTMGISKSGLGVQGVGYEFDNEIRDEVLFLGRKGDEIYFCEKNTETFRILRLCPDTSEC